MTVQAKTINVPTEVVEISEELGARYDICPELIQSICWRESRFTEDAVGGACVGIMQINPRFFRDRMDRLSVTDLYDAKQNMAVATDYLADLFEKHEDAAAVLMIYHGEHDVERKMEDGKISSYASEILEVSSQLEEKED